jgi:hypothetical protein
MARTKPAPQLADAEGSGKHSKPQGPRRLKHHPGQAIEARGRTADPWPWSTTTASRRSGCRRPIVASPIPITSRDANRHGRASHIVTNANFVALVAWWPNSYLHQ